MKRTSAEFLEEAAKKKLICFGAGRALEKIVGFLESEQLAIDTLIDNAPEKWGIEKAGTLVQSPDILKDCDAEQYIILISTKFFADEIERQIKNNYNAEFHVYRWPLLVRNGEISDERFWRERIYNPCVSMYKEIAKGRKNAEEYLKEKRALLDAGDKVILPRAPLVLTTRCTLRCKECSNLMPYFSEPKDYPLDEIVQWIDNICAAADEWICLELIGGEPFLYGRLKELLVHILEKDKIQQVEFTTNASVIPKHDILELLKTDKVIVIISGYPGLTDYRRLTKVFDENGIRYKVIENMRWIKQGEPVRRNRSREDLQLQYLNCGSSILCRTIMNGKLYACARAASLAQLGYAGDLEMVDVTDTDNLRENIRNFLSLTVSGACDYCDTASKDEEFTVPAEQMKRSVE